MALFKYANFLSQHKNGSFDLTFHPSSFVPCGGIYRCAGCRTEIALERVGLFPDRGHHDHKPSQGPIAWQLIVATVSTIPERHLHSVS